MLLLLSEFSDFLHFVNVFKYITFRAGSATVTAMIFVFLFGPKIIKSLRIRQGKGQPIRDDGPKSHLIVKTGTPTMGGLMILSGFLVSTLLWADLSNYYVQIVIFVAISFGTIGFYDDYLKVTKQNHYGFSGKIRLLIEFLITFLVCWYIAKVGEIPFNTSLTFPFFKNFLLDFGIFFIPLTAFIIVGTGNAVNLTDGLDGLAIVPVMIAIGSFGFIAYLSGNVIFADYLKIHHVPGTGELAIICGAIIGSGLGFLWFNAPPAAIFMGDTGSLSLGAILGTIAVITKHEILLAIIGGLFVFETISVIIQVASFKITGKRVFRMAPIHHHFEQKGWTESQIVIRFWIIAFVLSLIGLTTLKLR